MAQTWNQIAETYAKSHPERTAEGWQEFWKARYQKTKVNMKPKAAKPKKPQRIEATNASTCFESLTWKDGIATAVFAKNGATYQYEVSRDEFRDWIAGSLGQWFNSSGLYDEYL